MRRYLRHIGSIAILGLLLGWSAPIAGASLPISSGFGWRVHPIYGDWRFHAGLDLAYDEGTPIPALFAGQVVRCGDYGDGYGNQILLYHAETDTFTRYGHCSAVYVSLGEYVEAQAVIAAVGSTGNSTGPHLHLEYIVPSGDGAYEYRDPLSLWGGIEG